MTMRTGIVVLVVAAVVQGSLRAEGDGGLPGAYLRFGASARSLSMGGLDVVGGGGAESVYGNPAQIGFLDPLEFTATHAALYGDASYDVLTFSRPGQQWGGLLFGIVSLRCGGFEQRGPLDNRYSLVGEEFSHAQTALLAGWGMDLSRMAWASSIGGRLKFVGQSMLDERAWGFGLDLGVEHRMILPYAHRWIAPLVVGLRVTNLIQPRIQLNEDSETYPRRLSMGVSYSIQDMVLAGTQFCLAGAGSRRLQGGLEVRPRTEISLRLGANGSELSAGAGFNWRNVSVDYAVAWHDELPASHRVSITWGKSKSRQLESDGRIHKRKATRWVVQNYRDPEAARIGHLLASEADRNRARTYYRFVVGEHPNTVWAAHGWKWFGDDNYLSTDWSGAEKNYVKLLYHAHRDAAATPETWYRLGISAERQEHWEVAVEGYELVMGSEQPSQWQEDAHFKAGAIYFLHLVDFVSTVRVYEDAVLNYPEHDLADAFYRLGRAYAGLERWQSSVERLETFLARYPSDRRAPFAVFWMGRGLYELGLPEDALPRLEEVVEQYPEHDVADDALLYKGHCRRLMGNLAKAGLEYSRVVKDYPARESAALAQLALASVLQEEGSLESARREYQRFLANYPDHPGKTEALEHLGYFGEEEER
jgi:TolA-binding protein